MTTTDAETPAPPIDPEVAKLRDRLGEIREHLAPVKAMYAERNRIYCDLLAKGVQQKQIAEWAGSTQGTVWAALKQSGCTTEG